MCWKRFGLTPIPSSCHLVSPAVQLNGAKEIVRISRAYGIGVKFTDTDLFKEASWALDHEDEAAVGVGSAPGLGVKPGVGVKRAAEDGDTPSQARPAKKRKVVPEKGASKLIGTAIAALTGKKPPAAAPAARGAEETAAAQEPAQPSKPVAAVAKREANEAVEGGSVGEGGEHEEASQATSASGSAASRGGRARVKRRGAKAGVQPVSSTTAKPAAKPATAAKARGAGAARGGGLLGKALAGLGLGAGRGRGR